MANIAVSRIKREFNEVVRSEEVRNYTKLPKNYSKYWLTKNQIKKNFILINKL